MKTAEHRRDCWWPSDGARMRSPLPRSTAIKAASCIFRRISCSRLRARRRRAAACSRTAAWMNEAAWSCCSLRITRTSRRAKNLRVAACRCTTASFFRSSCIISWRAACIWTIVTLMSAHRSLVNDGTIAAGDALAFGSRTSAAEPGTGLGR
ncbi:hypothetical protein PVAP13_6NG018583 [Panicum virgatum]|uniref:Uncharacterized protein n=1 Tax=Panicum virgatum TaxID=38727 RepID=A0A8T0QT43_PANVG|nr:hypothetical protein PVAP13_6NG018583 [Panicum virgatum]